MKTTQDIELSQYPQLALIDTPDDLRKLQKENLTRLCDELRRYLLNCVSLSSGHLASGLGVVELTVALHYVYNTPFDRLIWDVGHQAYPHKILTGRRDQMISIRQKGGLHPFPWREESEYDTLSVGHSSTSISAGIGMAVAAQKEGLDRKTVCVIGDGALTAGMAFEAMNHTGDLGSDILVILNDNEMSISENVGALNNHLTRLLSGKMYTHLRESSKKMLAGMPPIKELLKKTEEHIKGLVSPGILFEEFGFNYLGPINGHDINELIQILSNIRNLKGPQFLHVVTKKGKGYEPAEKDPIKWHGVPQFDPNTGKQKKLATTMPSYSTLFGEWLCEMADRDNKLMAITPAMAEGSGMSTFAQRFPERFFDVAIAEQHAVTFAAGLAIAGYHPVVAIYSTFLQRAYDQVIHDVAIQNLPVLFAIDRAGIVGADGQTHQGAFDIAFLRCIPNIIIMTPSDGDECRQMLYTGYQHQGPAAVRYPKNAGEIVELQPLATLPIGKARLKRQGQKIAILNFGTLLNSADEASIALDATLVDMRFVKPLDQQLLLELAHNHDYLVTLEEGSIAGGAGSAVNEYLLSQHCSCHILNLGLPDTFIPQGEPQELRKQLCLDGEGIIKRITNFVQ